MKINFTTHTLKFWQIFKLLLATNISKRPSFAILSFICCIFIVLLCPIVNAADNNVVLDTIIKEHILSDDLKSNNTTNNITNINEAKDPDNTIVAPTQKLNSIVAYVNKNIITANQVDIGIKLALFNYKKRNVSAPDIANIKTKILDQLIMQLVQLDIANKNGIRCSDQELSDAINNIIQNDNTTLDDFKEQLSTNGLSFENFRTQIKTQIILDKLKQRAVDSRVVVTDDEVSRVLLSETYKNKIDYNLSMILISIPAHASADIIESRHKLALLAYQELSSGATFDNVSAKYSNSPNALNGGNLGFKSSVAMPDIINNELKELKIGAYTNIINLPIGFVIFKLNDFKKSGMPQVVKQYHVRHILIKINDTTSNIEALKRIKNIKQQLDAYNNNPTKQNELFINLAKQYSEDISSIKGGDLSYITKGETVPSFENAMLTLPLNTISDPILTVFGWHLIEVLDTKEVDKSHDLEKLDIKVKIAGNISGMKIKYLMINSTKTF